MQIRSEDNHTNKDENMTCLADVKCKLCTYSLPM